MRISIPEYLERLREAKSQLERAEKYEYCARIRDLISSIENRDVEKYILLNFDIKALTKAGFFKKGDSYGRMSERVVDFFGLNSVFEYSCICAEICSLVREAERIA